VARGQRSLLDYALALYLLGAKPGGRPAGPSVVAERLGVSRATAAVMLRRLEASGLVVRGPGGGARLTRRGVGVLARHAWKVGLLETLLSRAGLGAAEAARVARRLAPHLDDSEAAALCEALGHPDRCPHGSRIPHPCRGEESPEGSCALRFTY